MRVLYRFMQWPASSDLEIWRGWPALKLSETPSQWPEDARVLMGRTSASKPMALQSARLTGLKQILSGPIEEDEHAHTCVRFPMARHVWRRMADETCKKVCADSDLIELLDVDLRGFHCGECLILLGQSVQRCLYEARELRRVV
ncbi:hypothetical protein I312_101371 [Cryptococcus bacillisporus CA1280]|uniref:uncharacterized protein n=1 Tax=Cryptococcus bacillisporus CA1280 TaxID=1296109 RepID=UPI0033680394